MKRLLLVALFALAAYGGYRYYQSLQQPEDQGLRFHGNVETRTVTLGFRFIGEIVEMRKDEGEKVEQNETLVRLDDARLRQSLLEVQAKIAAEEAKLLKLQNGFRQEEITESEAMVKEARAALQKTKDIYQREQELIKNRATSKEKLINSRLNFEQSEAALQKAEALRALRRSGYRTEDIQAQKALVDSLRASALKIQTDIDDTVLTSPVKGVILSRFKEPGAIVNPGERVLEIAKSDEFWVRAYMDEPYLGTVNEGDRALIHTDRDKSYEGRVGFVSPIAEFTPKNVETKELRSDLVYRFRVIVQAPDSFIRQGMPVSVEILK